MGSFTEGSQDFELVYLLTTVGVYSNVESFADHQVVVVPDECPLSFGPGSGTDGLLRMAELLLRYEPTVFADFSRSL